MNDYVVHSKFIQNFLTISQIRELWNDLGFWTKGPASESTIRRWLNIGPKTKNPKFEPWIISLSQALRAAAKIEEVKPLSIDNKIDRLLAIDLSPPERATIRSLQTYKEDCPLSKKQAQIVDKIYARKIV